MVSLEKEAEPDHVGSCRQRREFGFDSKCGVKLVKGFKKKKNAGLYSHFKMVILPAVWKVICKKQRKEAERSVSSSVRDAGNLGRSGS